MSFSTVCQIYCSNFPFAWYRESTCTLKEYVSPCRPSLTKEMLLHPISRLSHLTVCSFPLCLYPPLHPNVSLLLHYSPSSTLSFFGCFINFLLSSYAPMIWPCCISRRIDFSIGLCVKPYLNRAQRNFLLPQSWMELILFHKDTFHCLFSFSSPSCSSHLLYGACRNRAGMINATPIATKH